MKDGDTAAARPAPLVPLRYVAVGGRGPEDVVADARGRVLTGVEDGRILRRVPALDLLHRRAPAVRRAAARLAVRAPYRPPGTVAVLAFDDEGDVVHHLARRRSGFRMATSVCTAAGHLVLGSVWEPGIALCAAPAPR
ncbi:Strictosidine Synthase [Streptomyces leeuwenhoekii]|uniref:Strictosidine Synthase n=1 Tax=Streptomyces leeuwenhoekii TaxID=1437453 RepID=A0A0F7W1B7_STRLW|nr:Strictosidine Synthase [Streptomyces leeuwenhoekii]